MNLILASASERRKQLLNRLGLDFKVIPSEIDEDKYKNTTPANMVKDLARAKAEDIAQFRNHSIIIGADTIVVNNKDKILGKPQNRGQARIMLNQLQNTRHQVYTGIAVLSTYNDKILNEYDKTEVYMRKLEKQEIEKYIESGEPLDKAGAYGIQGTGGIFINKIVGSYYTVMGLPLHKLDFMLKQFSINIL